MFHKIRIKGLEACEQAIWKGHAKHFGAHELSCSGVRIICKYRTHDFVKDALTRIEEFDSALWTRLLDSINVIIFIEQSKGSEYQSERK